MNFPEVIYAWRWLIRDTFRQSKANYVLWVMLAARRRGDLLLPERDH